MSETELRPYISAEELISRIRKYHPEDDMSLVQRAYEYAEKAHEGQVRKSGDPYFCHPVAVAVILTDAADAAAVNAVLHAHRGQIRGRMGLPVREYGLSVIHLTADGTRAELGALTDALSRLPGVRVKAARMPLSPDDPEA